MVQPVELLGTFNRDHITDIFYHADEVLYAQVVAANAAEIGIGNIVTAGTEFYFAPHFCNALTEMDDFIFFLFKQVKRQPQRGFFSDAGELRKLVNGCFEKLRRKLHGVNLSDKGEAFLAQS